MMCLPSRTKVFVYGVTRAHGKVNDEISLCSNINGGGKCRTEFLRCYGFAYYNMSRRNLSKTHARQPYCSGGDCREEDMEAIMGYEGAPLMYRGRMRHKGE